jgi:hypothetical protein
MLKVKNSIFIRQAIIFLTDLRDENDLLQFGLCEDHFDFTVQEKLFSLDWVEEDQINYS